MLNDTRIRKAKPAEKPYKMFDGGGLFLYVTKTGSKLWRMKYRHKGKEKTLSLGPYPLISLAEARAQRDAAKKVLLRGRDPMLEKRLQTDDDEHTFEKVARDWWHHQKARWKEDHVARVIHTLEKDVFPEIGQMPIKEITPPQVLAVVRKVEKRGALELARRLRQRMSAVFVFAIASGIGEQDPAAVIKGAMAHFEPQKQPAVVDLEGARQILKDVEAAPGGATTKLALRFLALTAVRSNELRGARWEEFEGLDGDAPTWRVPADRMKGLKAKKREHIVPLSRQAVEVLQALREINGSFEYVFPNARTPRKPMSENAMGFLLNRAGYFQRHVPHGWRSTFSTIMNERFPGDRQVIDQMLAHVPKDKVEAAYNRSTHMERRRELAQEWADMLMKGMGAASNLVR